MTREQWQQVLAGKTHPRRLMKIEESTTITVFMVSDMASGITGTTVNMTMGTPGRLTILTRIFTLKLFEPNIYLPEVCN